MVDLRHIIHICLIVLLLGCSNEKKSRESSHPLTCLKGKQLGQGVYEVNIGEFEEGQTISFNCLVKNSSDLKLELRPEVLFSCDCMGADLEKKILMPGENMEVRFHLSAKSIVDTQQMVRAKIFIHDPPIEEPLVLELYYGVKPSWVCVPAQVLLKADQSGWGRARVEVTSNGRSQFRVLSAQCSLPGSECVVIEKTAIEGETSVVAFVDTRCCLPIGADSRDCRLTIATNDVKVPSREIMMIAIPYTPLRVNPPTLRLLVDNNKIVTGTIMVAKAKIELMNVVTDNPLIEVGIESLKRNVTDGEIGRLIIRLKGMAPYQRSIAQVKISYRAEGSQEVLEAKVPVIVEGTR